MSKQVAVESKKSIIIHYAIQMSKTGMTQANRGIWPRYPGCIGLWKGNKSWMEEGTKTQALRERKKDQQKEPNTISCQHQRAAEDQLGPAAYHQHKSKHHPSPAWWAMWLSWENLPPVSTSILPVHHPGEVRSTSPTDFAEPHSNFSTWTPFFFF